MEEKILETYNITYSCGCIHGIEVLANQMHRPTGKQEQCKEHNS